MFISQTPYRISLFGGGTDYPSWYSRNGGEVISTTIDKFIYISCRYLPPFFEHRLRLVYSVVEACEDASELKHLAARNTLKFHGLNQGVEIHYDGDLPARSGMGSSSSFTVGLLNAIYAYKRVPVTAKRLAGEAIYIEQHLNRENVGSQDQINAAYGGFNRIRFHKNGKFSVKPISISQARKNELSDNLMLFYTGIMRTAEDVASSYATSPEERASQFTALSKITTRAGEIIEGSEPLTEIGELLHQSWMTKRELSAKVSNPVVDKIYDSARLAGALGGKLTGAGGGGMMLLFVPKIKQDSVKSALSNCLFIPFAFSETGSKIIFSDHQQRYEKEEKARAENVTSFVEWSEI